jgi:TonB-dependent SusC/RagA subfamily outer membrane receptor
VSKADLDNLSPEDIKSITVVEDEILIQTKDYKPESNIRLSTSLQENIKVRSTDKNDEKPLFVLDGKIISEDQLKNIKPDDIKSIEVLKDESAKAVYGEKGKNGVVIIKLKK